MEIVANAGGSNQSAELFVDAESTLPVDSGPMLHQYHSSQQEELVTQSNAAHEAVQDQRSTLNTPYDQRPEDATVTTQKGSIAGDADPGLITLEVPNHAQNDLHEAMVSESENPKLQNNQALPTAACDQSTDWAKRPTSIESKHGLRRSKSVAVMETVADADAKATTMPRALLIGGDKAASAWRTYKGSELPEWLHDNEFLVAWHRPMLGSYSLCLRTVFRLHTETGNIWSHGLGSLAATSAVAVTLATALHTSIYDSVVFVVFLLTASGCFAASATFHTFRCHSPWVARTLSKVDYCGIAVLTVGSFVPWLYYAFYCDGAARIAYLASVVALTGLAAAFYTSDRFSEPSYRHMRAASFVASGLSAVVPTVHIGIVNGLRLAIYDLSVGWLLLMAVLHIAGATVYATRVPERWFPGRFDLIGHSHQWLHVLSTAAVFVHLHGLRHLADYRISNTCPGNSVPATENEETSRAP